MFKKILAKIAKGSIKKIMINKKTEIVKKVNEKIDIPGLDEKKEEQLFNAILEAILAIL